jgi:RNA polymerase sigma factor (sigma-70 family)
MKNYNKSIIMKRAWQLFKKQDVRTDEMFAECLKMSWAITKKIPAFNEVYKDYKNLVMSQLRQKIKNESDCEELCNDIFMKVNEFLHTFNCERAKFSTWIYKFVENKIIDYFRGEGKRMQQQSNVSDLVNSEGQEAFTFVSHSETSSHVEGKELQSKISLAMSKLKPQYRRIAELFFLEQKEYKEIAEILDIPMGTVKGTLLRAKVMLQNALQAEYQML